MIPSRLSNFLRMVRRKQTRGPMAIREDKMNRKAMAREEEVKDKIRVLIKQAGQPHRSFYAKVTHLNLNGNTVGLFGRFEMNGSDRQIEVPEVVFRGAEDLEHFVQFELGASLARRKRLVPEPSEETSDPAAVGFAGDLRQKLWKRFALHPSIKVDSEIFKR